MGQTILPLEFVITTVPVGIATAKRCAVMSSMSGRRAVKSARSKCSRIAINQKKRPIQLPATNSAKRLRLVRYYLEQCYY